MSGNVGRQREEEQKTCRRDVRVALRSGRLGIHNAHAVAAATGSNGHVVFTGNASVYVV